MPYEFRCRAFPDGGRKQCTNEKKSKYRYCTDCHKEYQESYASIKSNELVYSVYGFNVSYIHPSNLDDSMTRKAMKAGVAVVFSRKELHKHFFDEDEIDDGHKIRIEVVKREVEDLNRWLFNRIDTDHFHDAFELGPQELDRRSPLPPSQAGCRNYIVNRGRLEQGYPSYPPVRQHRYGKPQWL